jgi:hypothetical protein
VAVTFVPVFSVKAAAAASIAAVSAGPDAP